MLSSMYLILSIKTAISFKKFLSNKWLSIHNHNVLLMFSVPFSFGLNPNRLTLTACAARKYRHSGGHRSASSGGTRHMPRPPRRPARRSHHPPVEGKRWLSDGAKRWEI